MTVFFQRLFAGMLLVLAASQASAITLGYDLTFKDRSGAAIGSGVVRYDPAVKVDLYATDGSGARPPSALNLSSLAGTRSRGRR